MLINLYRVVVLLACIIFILRKANARSLIQNSEQKFKFDNKILFDVISKPLEYFKIHLIGSTEVLEDFEFRKFFENGRQCITTVLNNDSKFENSLKITNLHQRGQEYIVVIALSKYPKKFLNFIENSAAWNPNFLLLFFVNDSPELLKIIGNNAIKRSRYLTVFRKIYIKWTKKIKYSVYTSLPFQSAKRNYFSMTYLFNWNAKAFSSRSQLFPERFKNFGGVDLLLASWCDDYPYLYNTNQHGCSGVSVDSLKIIGDKLNFSFTVALESLDRYWGDYVNGSWIGMLGELEYHNRDLIINVLSTTEERFKAFDFIFPNNFEGYAVAVALPPEVPKWYGMVNIFSPVTWYLFASSLFFAMISLSTLLILQDQNSAKLNHISWSFIVITGCFLNQSFAFSRNNNRKKLFIGLWSLLCITISTAYTGNLVAFLSAVKYPKRAESLEELAESGLRMLMHDYGHFLPDTVKTSNISYIKQLGTRFDLLPNGDHYNEGFSMVLSHTHALIEAASTLFRTRVDRNFSSNTYIMKQQLYPWYSSWIFPKNTPFKVPIENILRQLIENGIHDQLKKTLMAPYSLFSSNKLKTVTQHPLNLAQLEGIFMLVAISLIVASAVFISEIILFNTRVHQNK